MFLNIVSSLFFYFFFFLADALVDIYYYSQNAACKKGMNLSSVFTMVHAANMAKRDANTGKFIKRESDGKIIKPEGWQPPNVEAEIARQHAEVRKF